MFYPVLASAGADCSDPSQPGCFTFGVRLGLSFISQMACISGLSVTILLGIIIVRIFLFITRNPSTFGHGQYNHIQNVRRHPEGGKWPPHMILYLIALLVADLIQALGNVMSPQFHLTYI
jgi:hypothetical protein